MRRNGSLRISYVNYDTAIRFDVPDFLPECKIPAIWRCLKLIFAFYIYAECPPYFYFRFIWPTDLESIPHASTPASIITTKCEDRTTIRSWVMSYNVTLWLPLKMRTKRCACAKSRDLWVGVKNNYIFGIPDPDLRVHYATSVALRWM